MKTIVFLQNAWSPRYAGKVWPRESWLRALEASRTGNRLRLMLDDLSTVHNASPEVGPSPDSAYPPDEEHIKAILDAETPDVVVACGARVTGTIARLWPGPLLCLPHPAYRCLTNALYLKARELLDAGLTSRLRLVQRRNLIQCLARP